MATKDCYLSFKNKPNTAVTLNDQYSNLNLNQCHQFSNANLFHSKTTDCKKIQNYEKKIQSLRYILLATQFLKRIAAKICKLGITDCKNLQTRKSFLELDKPKKSLSSNYLNVNDNKVEKEELKNNSSKNSTLSLHISAYENLNETKNNDSNNGFCGDQKIGLKKKQFGLIKQFENANLGKFEFPRQQEKNDQSNPEIMQFKTSQKLNSQPAKEKNPTENRMMAGGGTPPSGGQSGNGIRRLWNKMGGNVEQTKMAPDFVKNMESYDSYKESVDLLVDRLEIAVQQNPNVLAASVIECPPNENPHEKTAASLAIFQTYFNQEKQASVKELIEENKKLAQIERAGQVQARKAIRHLRRFYIEQYKDATDERNKLNKAREHMDLMKHEVKQAKTTEQIEKKAVLYEEAVGTFDQQATKVIECLGQLPAIQQTHVKDIIDYFDTIGQFHTKMAAAIAKRDF